MNILKMSGAAMLIVATPALRARRRHSSRHAAAARQSLPCHRRGLAVSQRAHRGQQWRLRRARRRLFRQLSAKYPRPCYAPDAMYWEAFARYRNGGGDDLRRAQAILEALQTQYPSLCPPQDASSLSTTHLR